MAMGRRQAKQASFWVATDEVARAPGHLFYDRLGRLLVERGFDRFAAALARAARACLAFAAAGCT